MKEDYWDEGYKAGLSGKDYRDNPYEGKRGATPWAFGCSQGMSDRNTEAFNRIMTAIRDETVKESM
jgi:ribosome modulation factor